jgi:hypothetical protein
LEIEDMIGDWRLEINNAQWLGSGWEVVGNVVGLDMHSFLIYPSLLWDKHVSFLDTIYFLWDSNK